MRQHDYKTATRDQTMHQKLGQRRKRPPSRTSVWDATAHVESTIREFLAAHKLGSEPAELLTSKQRGDPSAVLQEAKRSRA